MTGMRIFLAGVVLLMSERLWADSAREVMQRVDEVMRAGNASTYSIMTLSTCPYSHQSGRLRCSESPRIKKIEAVQRQTGVAQKDSQMVSIILEPAADRGVGMLVYSYDDAARETQSWLYLSALGQVKRIIGGGDEHSEPVSFFGSELTTEDMQSGKLDEYDYTLISEEVYRQRPVWVIDVRPHAERLKKSRYGKTRVWVDKARFLLLKSQSDDKQGQAYKRMIASEIEQIKGVWVARSVLMMNLQNRRLTQMRLSEVVFNVTVPVGFLTQRSLTDFSFRERVLRHFRTLVP
jgi:hypothetical protein